MDLNDPSLDAVRDLFPDSRTTEEIEDAHDADVVSLRETLTGFPARPGVIR